MQKFEHLIYASQAVTRYAEIFASNLKLILKKKMLWKHLAYDTYYTIEIKVFSSAYFSPYFQILDQ